jgi:hypothetical protein
MPAATGFPALGIQGPRPITPRQSQSDPVALEQLRQRNRLELLGRQEEADARSKRIPSLKDLADRDKRAAYEQYGPAALQGDQDALAAISKHDPGAAQEINKRRVDILKGNLDTMQTQMGAMSQFGRALLDAPPERRAEFYMQGRAALGMKGVDTSSWPETYPGDERVKFEVNRAMTIEQKLAEAKQDPAYMEKLNAALARGTAAGQAAVETPERAEEMAAAKARGDAKGKASVPGGGRDLDRVVRQKIAEEAGLSKQRSAAIAAGASPTPRDIIGAYEKIAERTTDEAEVDRKMARLFGHDWRDVARGGASEYDPENKGEPAPVPRRKPAERIPGGATMPLRPTSGLGPGPIAAARPPVPRTNAAQPEPARAAERGDGTQASPFRISPHGPDAAAEFEVIKSGEYFVNPADGKTYRKVK